MRSKTSMHLSGYLPTVVSPLSMMASACSKTAFATSVTSARVGMGDSIMLSSQRVAFRFRKELAQLHQVSCLPHERERDEIHAQLQTESYILDVLRGERGQADLHSRQVNMTPAAQFALRQNF